MKIWALVAAGTLAAGAVAAGAAGAAATAHRWGGQGHGPFGGLRLLAMHHAMKELDLSDDQRSRVKEILRSHRGEFQEIVGRLHDVHEDVRRVAHQDSIDDAAIRAKVGAALDPLGDLAVLHAHVRQEIHGVLTPEQRQKAESLHEKLREHVQELHESMGELADDWLEDAR